MPYSSMEQANPSLKGIEPPISLIQANQIAAVADRITGVDSPWAVAISQFKKSHTVKDGKWVKKEGSEWGGKKEYVSGLKAIERDGDQYLVLWTSNAFEDDEKEIFATKAWEDYVERCDENPELRGRVWFWHVKSTDFADVVWQGMVGRILVEVAKVDNTAYGQKMFHALQNPDEHPDVVPFGWGTSHGYVYKPGTKHIGPPNVYTWVHKFETTVLPYDRAANKHGGVKEVIDMSVSKKKVEGLASIVGEDQAKQLLGDTEAASDEYEKQYAFKEKDEAGDEDEKGVAKPVKAVTEDEEDEEEKAEEEETAEESKEVWEMEVTDELMKEIAAHVPVAEAVEAVVKELMPKYLGEALKELVPQMETAVKEAVESTTVASKESIVQQAVAGTLRLTPYSASKDEGNVVSEKEVDEHFKGNDKAQQGDVVHAVVQRMLAGM